MAMYMTPLTLAVLLIYFYFVLITRDWPVEKLKEVTVAEALKHPNWSLGKDVTVDSATTFNKAHILL